MPNTQSPKSIFSCPSGGLFFACNTGSSFVGCCRSTSSSDVCGGGCPTSILEPASFDTAEYGVFPDQQCPAGASWYTCSGTNPPFMGCCKSNPCHQGFCPAKDLVPGVLSNDPAVNSLFLNDFGAMTATSTGTVTSTVSTSTSSATFTSTLTTISTSTSTPTALPAQSNPSPSTNIAAIAGAAAGGVALLLIIIGFVLWYCRRNARESRRIHVSEARGLDPLMSENSPPYNANTVYAGGKDLKDMNSPASSYRSPRLSSHPAFSPPQRAPTLPPTYTSHNQSPQNRHIANFSNYNSVVPSARSAVSLPNSSYNSPTPPPLTFFTAPPIQELSSEGEIRNRPVPELESRTGTPSASVTGSPESRSGRWGGGTAGGSYSHVRQDSAGRGGGGRARYSWEGESVEMDVSGRGGPNQVRPISELDAGQTVGSSGEINRSWDEKGRMIWR